MVGKLLTVVPLLVLSGLFFAAGILEGGILFLASAVLMLWAYLRRGADGSRLTAAQMAEIEARTAPVPGGPRRGPDGGG
jgi:hypothetical protein